METYVLLSTEANALWNSHALIEDLEKKLENVQRLKDVRGTETLITIPPPVRE